MKRKLGSRNKIDDPGNQGSKNKDRPGYDVGYGKPPKEHQFQPGQSGNPKGRPKGAKNLATIFREALDTSVSIRTGETVHTMSKRRAMIEVAINRALKGDMRALDTVFKLCSILGEFAREAEAASAATIQIRFVEPDGKVVPPEEMPEWFR